MAPAYLLYGLLGLVLAALLFANMRRRSAAGWSAPPTREGLPDAQTALQRLVRAYLARGALLQGYTDDEVHLLVPELSRVVPCLLLLHPGPPDGALERRLSGWLRAKPGLHLVITTADDALVSALPAWRARPGFPRGGALACVHASGRIWASSMVLLQQLARALHASAEAAMDSAEWSALLQAVREEAQPQLDEVRRLAALGTRRPVATQALLALLGIAFVLELLWSRAWDPIIPVLVRMGAETATGVHRGEWWRLLSASFLHGGVGHLLLNGFALFSLGSFLERLLGTRRLLLLYGLSVLAGSALSVLLAPRPSISVGASGGICGLLAASGVLGFLPRGQVPAILAAGLRRDAKINLLLNGLYSLQPGINLLAHLGGALAGALLSATGILLPSRLDAAHAPATWRERLTSAGALATGAALVAALGLALLTGRPWQLAPPLRLVRQPLGQSGLTMEVPALLGTAAPAGKEDGVQEVIFGQFPEDPFVVACRVQSGLPEDDEVRAELKQELWKAVREGPRPERGRAAGPPTEHEIGGYPAIMQTTTLDNQVMLHRVVQLRARQVVGLEVVLPPNLPRHLALDPLSLLATVR